MAAATPAADPPPGLGVRAASARTNCSTDWSSIESDMSLSLALEGLSERTRETASAVASSVSAAKHSAQSERIHEIPRAPYRAGPIQAVWVDQGRRWTVCSETPPRGMMQAMRALGLAFAFAACTGCASSTLPAPLPEDLFAARTEGIEANYEIRVLSVGDEIVGLGVPLSMTARNWPAAVTRTIDAIQPGGTILWSGRIRGARGDGYFVESSFAANPASPKQGNAEPGDQEESPTEPVDVRSLWVDARGKVLERTHTMQSSDAPTAVLAAATQTIGKGAVVTRVRVVWGAVLEEGFQITLRDEDAQIWKVRTDLDGDVFGVAQVRAATITAWQD